MRRRLNWQAGLAAAYAGLQANQAIFQMVTKVLVAGPNARDKLSNTLRSIGYWVLENDVGLELVRHVRPDETTNAEPIDLLVLDTSGDRQTALEALEAVRMADWALPIVALVDGIEPSLEQEFRRLGVTAWFDRSADIDSIRTAIVSLVPPIARAQAAA